jgi:thiol:disulfide interchange protein DsbD
MDSRLRPAIALSLLLVSSARLPAQSPAESHAKLELIAEQSTAPAGKPLWLGILFRLDPGWHIYWQNPGDSGEPPKVQWQLPPGFAAGPILWPVPIRLGSGTIIDYGYESQALLMAPFKTASQSRADSIPQISADVKYIVCREICIPGNAHLTLGSATSGDATRWRGLFEQTRQQLPKPAPPGWKMSAESDKNNFVLRVAGATRVRNASFFPLEPNQVDNSSPQHFASNRSGFQLTLKKSDQLVKPISTLKGLIIVGPGRAYEVSTPVVSK